MKHFSGKKVVGVLCSILLLLGVAMLVNDNSQGETNAKPKDGSPSETGIVPFGNLQEPSPEEKQLPALKKGDDKPRPSIEAPAKEEPSDSTGWKLFYLGVTIIGIRIIYGLHEEIKRHNEEPQHRDREIQRHRTLLEYLNDTIARHRITYCHGSLNLGEDSIVEVRIPQGIHYGGEGKLSLARLLNSLRLLSENPRVQGVVFDFDQYPEESITGLQVPLGKLKIGVERAIVKTVAECKATNPRQQYIAVASSYGPKAYYIANKLDQIYLAAEGTLSLHWYHLHQTVSSFMKQEYKTTDLSQLDKTIFFESKYKLLGFDPEGFKRIINNTYLTPYAICLEKKGKSKSSSWLGGLVSAMKSSIRIIYDLSYLNNSSLFSTLSLPSARALDEGFVDGTYKSKEDFLQQLAQGLSHDSKQGTLLLRKSNDILSLPQMPLPSSTSTPKHVRMLTQPTIDIVYINGEFNQQMYYNVAPILWSISENPAMKGTILVIDSPGGQGNISRALSELVKIIAEKKPITAYTLGQCCSAGYRVASQARSVVADETAMIGSIGVRVENDGKFTEKEYKECLKRSREGFINCVADSRCRWQGYDKDDYKEKIRATEARIYSAKEAQELGLIDELGKSLDDSINAMRDAIGTPCTVFTMKRDMVRK